MSSPSAIARTELSEIDASTRAPVVFFVCAAVLWLLVGTTFALISSVKLHTPDFLGSAEWLTFGRTRPAHLNSVIYGWSFNAAFAVVFWLMARLSCAQLRHADILYAAGIVWNTGVAIGVIGILKGDSTSVEWLEIPPYATPLIFMGYALVGAWAIITFRFGKARHIYVSQWYVLAALFWFPWLYSIAQIMLIFEPARGTVQSLVNWWYAHNLTALWFTPVGLGAVYYFLPKILGKPIHSYHLSIIGFWTFALFSSWTGVTHLIGGPVPAWVVTAGIAASFMMVVPVIIIGINHHMTLLGSLSALKHSLTLRFIVFGAVNFTLTSLIDSLMSSRAVSETLHFTQFDVAHAHEGMYAFFTMTMFGSIYYILPRVLLREWPSATLIRVHFWTTTIGAMIYVVGLSIGGIVQGTMMNATNPDGSVAYTILQVVHATLPYLLTRSVAGIILTIGHVAFAINIFQMLRAKRTAPAFFRAPEPMEAAAK